MVARQLSLFNYCEMNPNKKRRAESDGVVEKPVERVMLRSQRKHSSNKS